jgi:hypothetical protein
VDAKPDKRRGGEIMGTARKGKKTKTTKKTKKTAKKAKKKTA